MPGRVDASERDRLRMGRFPSAWLRETAATVGWGHRQRKLAPVTCGGLGLGFGTGVQRRLALRRRAKETVSGVTLVRVNRSRMGGSSGTGIGRDGAKRHLLGASHPATVHPSFHLL